MIDVIDVSAITQEPGTEHLPEAHEVPIEPAMCRRYAESELSNPVAGGQAERAAAWALLGILGELTEIRREMKRRR